MRPPTVFLNCRPCCEQQSVDNLYYRLGSFVKHLHFFVFDPLLAVCMWVHEGALAKQRRRDRCMRCVAVSVQVELVVVGDEGLGCGAAGNHVHHRRLDLARGGATRPRICAPGHRWGTPCSLPKCDLRRFRIRSSLLPDGDPPYIRDSLRVTAVRRLRALLLLLPTRPARGVADDAGAGAPTWRSSDTQRRPQTHYGAIGPRPHTHGASHGKRPTYTQLHAAR